MEAIYESFASVSALGAFIESTLNDKPKLGEEASRKTSQSMSWCLNTSVEDAATMAVEGGNWPEGAADLQAVSIEDSAQRIADTIAPAIVHDVTGGLLDVPEYLSNQSPEIFMRLDDETEQQKPVVRIAATIVVSAGVSVNQLMNRGRAMLALVDALELQGYSVELDGMYPARKGGFDYYGRCTVKSAGDSWDASSAAFVLAHPAFARRLFFRALEFSDSEKVQGLTHDGYGGGFPNRPEGYDVFFAYETSGGKYDTPDKALEAITAEFKKQKPELGL